MLGNREGMGVAVVNAKLSVVVLGMMATGEYENAKKLMAKASDGSGDITEALRVMFWQGYMLSVIDMTEVLDGDKDSFEEFAKSKAKFEQMLSELKSELAIARFSAEVDSYGVSDD